MSTLVESLNTSKTARLDIKTTEFAKEFIRRAAAISGLDMTSFIMSSAFERAETVMKNYSRLELSDKAFNRLEEILRESEEIETPNSTLVNLIRSKNGQSRDRKLRS